MKQGDVDIQTTLVAQTITTTTNLTYADGQSAHGVCHAINIGDSGDTLSGSVYWTVTMQDSDATGSGWATVTDSGYIVDELNSANASGVLATIDAPTEDQITVAAHYVGPKRYSRLRISATGTHTNGTPCAGVAVLSHNRKAP
jgi:hypothetical protein